MLAFLILGWLLALPTIGIVLILILMLIDEFRPYRRAARASSNRIWAKENA